SRIGPSAPSKRFQWPLGTPRSRSFRSSCSRSQTSRCRRLISGKCLHIDVGLALKTSSPLGRKSQADAISEPSSHLAQSFSSTARRLALCFASLASNAFEISARLKSFSSLTSVFLSPLPHERSRRACDEAGGCRFSRPLSP